MGMVYQRCPFCGHVFEIGPADYRPMKRHIRIKYTEPDDGSISEPPVETPVASCIFSLNGPKVQHYSRVLSVLPVHSIQQPLRL